MDARPTTISTAEATVASGSDDRIWAALAHGSAFLMFFGPLIPVVLWFTQRKKSAYVRFQALQAMIYQSLFFWAWFTIVPFLLIILTFIWIFIMAAVAPDTNDPFLIGAVPQIAIWTVMLGGFLLYGLTGLLGAIFALLGRDFRYPLFGARMARYLNYDGPANGTISEEKEDRVVAAVSHATCVLLFLGLLTPITVWLTQHERSRFLRFQAMQAAIYQALGLIGYFSFMLLDMVLVFGMFGAALVSGPGGSSSGLPAWLPVIMLAFLCVMGIFALGIPLYHLFGFLGSVGVLRGRNFRYPILGNFVASRMKPMEEQ